MAVASGAVFVLPLLRRGLRRGQESGQSFTSLGPPSDQAFLDSTAAALDTRGDRCVTDLETCGTMGYIDYRWGAIGDPADAGSC